MDYGLARKRLGLTQTQLASIIGVDQSTVALWESGKTKPRVSLLPKVAEILQVSVDDLLSCDKNASQRETDVQGETFQRP